MDTLAYKPTLEEVLPRLRALFERRASDRIFARMAVPSQALAEFAARYSSGYCADPDLDERIEFWDRLLRERSAVEDDSIPSAYLSELDQGLYGGLFGGDVQFMAHPENGWISSMVPPLLEDWSQFESLHFDPEHPWFRRYLRQLDRFVHRASGKFGISHFILIDGLNFVFELVGATKTYTSLLDHPETVRRAIELAFDLNLSIQTTFFDRVPLLNGGTCSNMVEWIPGQVVSESVDPFHMTSIDYLEQWGREPIERILGRFDGGVLHIHGNGRHLLETVGTLKGLKAVFLGDDHGFPSAFDLLDELRQRTNDLPLIVNTDYDRFTSQLANHKLAGGILYKVSSVPNTDVANRLMDRVRSYRR